MLQVYKFTRPVISIILATFNRADLIGRAIDSVLKQTFDGWELIIVDDGSTDGTFSIIEQYMPENSNIRYLKHIHRGLPLSRNAGLQAAVGEYAAFLDSDDEYEPEHLERRIKYMKKNTDIDLIHGGLKIIGNPFVPDKDDSSREVNIDQCAVGGTFFGKRYIFQSLGGFRDIEYSEDSEFLDRAAQIYTVKKVDFPTYIYHRETSESICSSRAIDFNSTGPNQ